MYAFQYHRPQSVADAAKLLAAEQRGQAAGRRPHAAPDHEAAAGQPDGHRRSVARRRAQGIDKKGSALVIGAMTTHDEVATSSVVRGAIAGLCEVAGGIGDPHVRNRGTIGGSVANNDPAADYPAALLALGATHRHQQARDHGRRLLQGPVRDGARRRRDHHRISFPVPAKFAYVKFANPASRYALVGVAVAQTGKDVARRRDGRRQQRRLPPQGGGGGARGKLVARRRSPTSPPTRPT